MAFNKKERKSDPNSACQRIDIILPHGLRGLEHASQGADGVTIHGDVQEEGGCHIE